MGQIMSEEIEAADATVCCASCGIAEQVLRRHPFLDDIEMVRCTDCDLVRYCSDKCQERHRPQHKEACKRRVAEIRDELLFKQPESSHLGDCPICCLPLPIDSSISRLTGCCSKVICNGCEIANKKREAEMKMRGTCPFCREPVPKTKEAKKLLMKRVEANDPLAMCQQGGEGYDQGDYRTAFEYWAKAAELGDIGAHYQLSVLYLKGQGVEKDEAKYIHHAEEAAIGGHPDARYSLGCHEVNKNDERAVKHFVIAANLGHDMSLAHLKKGYKCGKIKKEDFAAALRAHQAAVDATKSPQREAAEKKCADYSTHTFSNEDFAAALRAHQAAVDATKSPQRGRQPRYSSKMVVTGG